MAITKGYELGQLANDLTVDSAGSITIDNTIIVDYEGFDSDFNSKSTANLSEGSNLYYTQSRFDSAFASKSTTSLSEGSNLYYTNARADARIAAADTDDLSEGSSNLYYTNARADARAQLKIDALVGSAPGTLDTLQELGDALGDDANFSTTITNSIATKLPLAGGTLTGNLSFGDNDKAIFGAGSDLQIYHDGTRSYVDDTGAGSLWLRGGDVAIKSTTSETMAEFANNGAVSLYYNGTSRLTTTNTGVDVTGTIISDGLNVEIPDNDSGPVTIQQGGNSYFKIVTTNSSEIVQIGNSTTKPDVLLGGGNVGIGTASPQQLLHIQNSSGDFGAEAVLTGRLSTGTPKAEVAFKRGTSGDGAMLVLRSSNSSGSLIDAVTVKDGTGNVGIGTTSPGYKLQVDHSTGSEYVSSIRNTSDNLQLLLGTTTGGLLNIQGKTISSNAAYQIALQAEGGNVGIGTTSPAHKFHIYQPGNSPQLRISGNANWDFYSYNDNNFYVNNASGTVLGLLANKDAYFSRNLSVGDSVLSTYHTDYPAVDIGSSASVQGYTGNNGAWLQSNLFMSVGGQWTSKSDDYSAMLELYDGNFNFYNTASGTGTRTLLTPMTIRQSGNVGIGETSPNQPLVVKRATDGAVIVANTAQAGGQGLGFFTDTANNRVGVFNNSSSTHDMVFNTQGIGTAGEAMRIDNATKNVGIGTTNPQGVLDLGAASTGRSITWAKYNNVFGSYSEGSLNLTSNYYGNTSANAYKTSSTATYGAAGIEISGVGGSSNSGVIQFFVDPQTSKTADAAFVPTERMRITSDGYIQANSQSQVKLTLGNAGTPGTNNANWIRGTGNSLGLNAASDNIHFEIGGSEKFKISASGGALFNNGQDINQNFHVKSNGNANSFFIDGNGGNVGIGTTSLYNKLHVNGNTRIVGNLMAGTSSASNVPAKPIHVKSSGDDCVIRIEDSTSSNLNFDMKVKHGEGFSIIDQGTAGTSNNTRLHINTSGNVGIGTTDANGSLELKRDNTRFILSAASSNLAAQHRIEFWEGVSSSTAANANFAIEYDGTTSYGGDGALLFKGSASAPISTQDYVFGGISRTGTTFFMGDLGVGTTSPSTKLHVEGVITAGDSGGTSGSVVLQQRYNPSDFIATLGTMYSSGGWLMGYGINPKTSALGYVSSFDNFSGKRSAVELTNTFMGIHYAPAQQTTVGSDITGLTTPFYYDLQNGRLGIGTTSPNFALHINKGTSSYSPSPGINENVFGINTTYDAAGSQNLTFSRLDGNWLDGKTGADSAFGWLWNYQNSVRGGMTYDHRGSEQFQIFSSYAPIVFYTPDAADGNGVPTDSNMNERLRISNNGISFNGDTAAANSLDDYEEGTWAPVITPESGSAASITVNHASYTKVGRLVSLVFDVTIISISGTSSSYAIELTGMPFNSATSHGGGPNIAYGNLTGSMTGTLALSAVSTSKYRIVNLNGSTALNASDHLQATSRLEAQFTYHTT